LEEQAEDKRLTGDLRREEHRATMELSLWWGKKNGAGGRDLAFIAKGAEWEFELKIQRSKLSQI
jgi:hypothetical protein